VAAAVHKIYRETKNESDGLLELPGYVLYGGDAEDD
jgi:hypothetical protein